MLNKTAVGQVSPAAVRAAVKIGEMRGIMVDEASVGSLPTMRAVARSVGIEFTELYNFAMRKCGYKPTRICRRISDEQEEEIRDLLKSSQLTTRQIAAKLGISHTSIKTRKRRLQRQELIVASTEQDFVKKEHRCSIHGVVAYSPCPACAAVRAALETRERALAMRKVRNEKKEDLRGNPQ